MSFIKSSSFNVLYTKDLLKTENFYNLIGAELLKSENHTTTVNIGDFSLHFVKSDSEPFEEYRFIANQESYGSGNIFYIEVSEIEEFLVLVQKAGGIIKSQIKDNHWECREFLFEDPNGYKFAAYQ